MAGREGVIIVHKIFIDTLHKDSKEERLRTQSQVVTDEYICSHASFRYSRREDLWKERITN